jgi:hypothetical protein
MVDVRGGLRHQRRVAALSQRRRGSQADRGAKPEGEPWTRFVAVLVTLDETIASRAQQLAHR